MANYKETTVAGSAWTRSFSVSVDNPFNAVPSITFAEEDIFVVGGEVIHRPKENISANILKEYLADTTKEFDIVNPLTDEFIRKATYREIYVTLYSLYKALAIKRDTMPPSEAPIPPTTA